MSYDYSLRPGAPEMAIVRPGRPASVIYGLIAAAGWGLSAVAATHAARRAGTYMAVLSGQAIGVLVLLSLTAALRPSFAAVDGHVAAILAGAGLLGLLGYLTFYRALEYGGAVGLVSAISATYGGVTTVLAVLLLGEHLGAYGTAGVVLAVAGVAMASASSPATAQAPPVAVGEPMVGVAPAPTRLLRPPRSAFPAPALRARPRSAPTPSKIRNLSRAGIPLAFASALAYGVGGFLLGDYSARAGWLTSALVAHGTSVIALLVALPFLARRKPFGAAGSGITWAAVAGLTDVVGLLAFSRGGSVGQVAVTAAVSSIYPAIPLVAGLAMFGERLSRRQFAGVGLIVTGLVLIGLG